MGKLIESSPRIHLPAGIRSVLVIVEAANIGNVVVAHALPCAFSRRVDRTRRAEMVVEASDQSNVWYEDVGAAGDLKLCPIVGKGVALPLVMVTSTCCAPG